MILSSILVYFYLFSEIITTDQKNILFDCLEDGKRMIAYASLNQLQILSVCERWNIDGTWKPANLFEQVYIIGGLIGGEFFQCIFVFLEGKSEMDYNFMLRKILETSPYPLKPKVFIF